MRIATAPPLTDAHLSLLSGFELRLAGRGIALATNLQRVLAVLALRGRTSRCVLAGTLWPEVTDQHAQGSLRTAVWRLNRIEPSLVEASITGLDLNPGVQVDIRAFIAASKGIIARSRPWPVPEEDLHLLDPSSALSGELLPGWCDDWVIFERDRLRQLRLHALDALAAEFIRHRWFGEALDVALESVRLEPLRESAHRWVIVAHLAEQNIVEAVRHFAVFSDLLRVELDIEPSPQLVDLFPTGVREQLAAWRTPLRGGIRTR